MIILDKLSAVIDWTSTYLAAIAYQTCALMFAPDLSEWDDMFNDHDPPGPDRRLEPVDIIDRIDALVNQQIAEGKQAKR